MVGILEIAAATVSITIGVYQRRKQRVVKPKPPKVKSKPAPRLLQPEDIRAKQYALKMARVKAQSQVKIQASDVSTSSASGPGSLGHALDQGNVRCQDTVKIGRAIRQEDMVAGKMTRIK